MSEQRIVLAERPNGKPTGETFRYESFELADLREGKSHWSHSISQSIHICGDV